MSYTWTHGKRLESITDGDNNYSYVYDTDGIRVEKTVNNVTTKLNTLNGVVLAQQTGLDRIYFQYDGGIPFGFILNDIQYIYITNLNGDIVGITDTEGNLIAEYSYDEWGKLLSITADSDESYAIAETNPLRYRGYYYDNETGYYYLQSRYYDPELCRFISADSFDYIDTDTTMSANAYIYCINNPLIYSDPTGYLASEAIVGSAIAALVEAIMEALGYLITGLVIGVVVGGVVLIGYIIASIFTAMTRGVTKTLPDVKAKEQDKKGHYKITYVNDRGELIKIGNKLTFIEALAALGITATTNEISKSYDFVYKASKVSSNVKTAYSYGDWGIYADSQSAAKALAYVLGSNEKPEVHGSGYYGHYHDVNHIIHIWFGSPVQY